VKFLAFVQGENNFEPVESLLFGEEIILIDVTEFIGVAAEV
jgi:hypothetical protein